MWIASQNNNVEAMQWLFDHGAQEDVRTPNNNGVTPMYIASHKNNVEAMQWLFDHGADVRTPDNDGATPMSIASQKNNMEAMQWLFDHGADVRTPDNDGSHTHVRCKLQWPFASRSISTRKWCCARRQ